MSEKNTLPKLPKELDESGLSLIHLLHKYQRRLTPRTASSKTRSEVRGGGRKPYRQKGTGRARQGTIRTPLKKGGGVIFGPKPRDFSIRLNQKVIKKALINALVLKSGVISVLEKKSLDISKTKEAKALIKGDGKTVVLVEQDAALERALRNLKNVSVSSLVQVDVNSIISATQILISESQILKLEEVLK